VIERGEEVLCSVTLLLFSSSERTWGEASPLFFIVFFFWSEEVHSSEFVSLPS
jgi:hypothetical protein